MMSSMRWSTYLTVYYTLILHGRVGVYIMDLQPLRVSNQATSTEEFRYERTVHNQEMGLSQMHAHAQPTDATFIC